MCIAEDLPSEAHRCGRPPTCSRRHLPPSCPQQLQSLINPNAIVSLRLRLTQVQAVIGAKNAMAFDLTAACSGFVVGVINKPRSSSARGATGTSSSSARMRCLDMWTGEIEVSFPLMFCMLPKKAPELRSHTPAGAHCQA